MKITVDTIEDLIKRTRSCDVEWFRSEGIKCFNCEFESMYIVICRYISPYGATIQLTFADDWGTVTNQLKKREDEEDYGVYNSLYDFIYENATLEI